MSAGRKVRRREERKRAMWREGIAERVVELQWIGEAPKFRGPSLNARLDAIEKKLDALLARGGPT